MKWLASIVVFAQVFCSYLFGRLTYLNLNPSFALYYGSSNSIGNYKYDITEEYHDIKVDVRIFCSTSKDMSTEIKNGYSLPNG